MPVQPIAFEHDGRVIQAPLMYNFADLANVVTIILIDAIEGVRQTMLFVYENKEWRISSEIAKLHPVTVKRIIEHLKATFVCDEQSHHILAVHSFLS